MANEYEHVLSYASSNIYNLIWSPKSFIVCISYHHVLSYIFLLINITSSLVRVMYVAKYMLYVCVLSKPDLNTYIILIGTIQCSSDDDNNDNCRVLSGSF